MDTSSLRGKSRIASTVTRPGPQLAEPEVLDVATMIPNISCERCHGPGRTHVEGARSGAPTEESTMPLGLDSDASSEVRFCGTCHRLPGRLSPSEIRPDNVALARFPSVGLLESKCYRKSQSTFRCSTCHDPHARVSRDTTTYQDACISCHRAKPQRTCSVSPRTGCIACHMPKREVGHGLTFTDHGSAYQPEPRPDGDRITGPS